MADATTAQPNTQLPTDIASIISLITGLTGNQGAATIAQSADPWGPQRSQYQTQLNSFMADPSSVLKDPAFTAAENVGAENISRQAGAAGMADSGNRLADLFTYGQTAGLNFEQQKFNQLQQLAGVNAGSPVAAAGLQLDALQNQGTNLSTGLAGVIPMIAQLLGLTGGSTSGIAGIIQRILGGGTGGPTITDPSNPGFVGPPDPGNLQPPVTDPLNPGFVGPPDLTTVGPPDLTPPLDWYPE